MAKYLVKTYTTHFWFPDGSEDHESEVIDEEEVECDRLTEVFTYLKRKGVNEASSTHFHKDVWYYTTDSETHRSLRRGGHEETTFHMRRMPEKAQRLIWNALVSRGVLGRGYKKA